MVETFINYFSPASNEGFDGIIRYTFNHYLGGFSGFIQGSSDILLAKLYAIYKCLLLAKDMSINELVYYYNSSQCVNFIKELLGLRRRFDGGKNGKSSKKLQISCCLGRKAQPSGPNFLFAICFLRNARAGLRIAQ
ncbi:replication protein A1-like protein, partial [Trifolium medium]|nr:replication protein A1-like protein [Trifolium medium]